MNVLKILGKAFGVVVIIAFGTGLGIALILPLISQPVEKVVEKIVEPDFSGIGYAPITIIGIRPTTTQITGFNTMDIASSTPTTTEYFALGTEIDQVNLYLSATNTSTPPGSLAWTLEFSPINSDSTNTPFFALTSGSISSGLTTWLEATTTNIMSIPITKEHNRIIPLCNSNYDGLDDIPSCNAGWYKLELGRADSLSGHEVYAEILAKTISR